MAYTIPNEADVGIHADQADVDSANFQQLADAIGGAGVEGVGGGAELLILPLAAPGMAVRITTAGVVVGNVAGPLTARQAITTKASVTVTANASGNPRWDIVCASLTADSVTVTAGTPAAIPEEPATPADSVILAAIYVPNGAASITAANILDRRTFPAAQATLTMSAVSSAPAGATNAVQHFVRLLSAVVALPHYKDNLGGEYPLLGGPLSLGAIRGQCGLWTPAEGGPVRDGLYGGTGYVETGAGARTDGMDNTHGLYHRYTVNAGVGNSFGFQINTAGVGAHELGFYPLYSIIKVRLNDTTDVRFFAGLSDATIAQMTAADAPVFNYSGFTYSTPRGDANWQSNRNDGAGGAAIGNSGQAVATYPCVIILLAQWTSAFGGALIYDPANPTAQLYGALVTASNRPALTTRLGLVVGMENRSAGSSKSFDCFYGRGAHSV